MRETRPQAATGPTVIDRTTRRTGGRSGPLATYSRAAFACTGAVRLWVRVIRRRPAGRRSNSLQCWRRPACPTVRTAYQWRHRGRIGRAIEKTATRPVEWLMLSDRAAVSMDIQLTETWKSRLLRMSRPSWILRHKGVPHRLARGPRTSPGSASPGIASVSSSVLTSGQRSRLPSPRRTDVVRSASPHSSVT
jgi:hypothetical protein